MKRTVYILCAVCLLLSGCGVIKESDEPLKEVPVSTLSAMDEADAFRIQKSAVYFYKEQSDSLTAEIRSLYIREDENPAKAAIELLLEGPFETGDLIGTAPEGMKLSFIEYTRDVVNVYLYYSGEDMQPEQKFLMELSIANTVTDLLEAEHVCIFYNGMYSGFSGFARAPLQKHTGSVSEAYGQAYAKYIGVTETNETEDMQDDTEDMQDDTEETQPPQTQPPIMDESEGETEEETEGTEPLQPEEKDMMTVLYFVSEDGAFILPEVRNITYSGDNYAESIIRELVAGPDDTSSMKSFLPQEIEMLAPPIIEEDRITISLSELPMQSDLTDEYYYAAYAALVYTLTGFLPDIKSVDITVLGQPITDFDSSAKLTDGIQRADYLGLVGSSVPIYLQDKSSDLLLETQRSMEQSKTWSPLYRLYEILRGPIDSDTKNTWAVTLTGMTEEDILSVQTYDDTVVVNLSQNFKDICQSMSEKNENLLVYSMVNTLTAMDDINKVQFLIEGKQADTLGGTLCISDPFLMNYGIIKQ